ncbi:MAG: transposase [Tahibacter sp.]
MPDYRRAKVPGGCYFFTVALAERGGSLLVDRIDALRLAFQSVRDRHAFSMPAVVVLPDHLHRLWTLPPGDANYAMRWASIKAHFSRDLPAIERVRVSGRRKRERGVRQPRYWEHLIRDDIDVAAHVDYIHFNPVKHSLVERASDWPHSSSHRYVQPGQLSGEWGSKL